MTKQVQPMPESKENTAYLNREEKNKRRGGARQTETQTGITQRGNGEGCGAPDVFLHAAWPRACVGLDIQE